MHKKFSVLLLLSAVLLVPSQSVQAGIFGEGLGGAVRGAILGNLLGGRSGAEAGAIVGGLIGAGEAASRNRKQKEQQAAIASRQAEFQARQQAEEQRHREQMAQQRPQAAAAPAVDQTLLIETQKSLIRLGYEPGNIGAAGPELIQAIRDYQRSMGLLETGDASQALLTHMLRNGG